MVLQAAIEGLNATVGKAIGRIENAIAISDQAQKASLALGMSLEGANKTLDGSIKGLRGSFGTRLQAGLAALNAGFQGNIESVGKLINQQQLTGGNFRKTAAGLAKLETTMGLTRGQTSDLAEAMLETNKTFGVSTDKLVASLDALSESMPILTEAGLAGVPGAVAAMAGRVGPQMEQELKRVMGFLFDPSMETQGKLAALGLGNLRERMSSGQNPLDAFLDAIPQASNVIGQLGGDLSQFYAGFSVPLKMFGPVAKDFIALQKAMSARSMVEVRNQAEFFEQIGVLKSEILAPLDQIFSEKFFPVVLDFVKILKEATGPLVQQGVDKLKTFLSNPKEMFMDFAKFIDPIITSTVDTLNTVLKAMSTFARAVVGILVELDALPGIDLKSHVAERQVKMIEGLNRNIIEPLELEMKRFRKKHGDTYLQDPKFIAMEKDLAKQRAFRFSLDKMVDESITKLLNKIKAPNIPAPERMFQSAMERMAAETAENTAATAEHTDPDKLKDQIPFMLDASITSLGDALLSISRRAVEEPDPFQEAQLSLGAAQLDAIENSGRGGIGRKL